MRVKCFFREENREERRIGKRERKRGKREREVRADFWPLVDRRDAPSED